MAGPYSLTISPVGFSARPGQYVIMTVTDSGTRSITVNSLPSILSGTVGKCRLIPAPQQLAVSPARFTLKPDASRRVTVTINKNANSRLAIVFYATERTNRNLKVNAGAAAQITTSGKPLQCSAVIPAKSGIPVVGIGLALAGVAIIGLAIWAVFLRRQRGAHLRAIR